MGTVSSTSATQILPQVVVGGLKLGAVLRKTRLPMFRLPGFHNREFRDNSGFEDIVLAVKALNLFALRNECPKPATPAPPGRMRSAKLP